MIDFSNMYLFVNIILVKCVEILGNVMFAHVKHTIHNLFSTNYCNQHYILRTTKIKYHVNETGNFTKKQQLTIS